MRWSAIPFLTGAFVLIGLIANWSWELIQLDRLRHNGRTALATVDQTDDHSDPGPGGSGRWVTYHFVPRDSQTRYQGQDLIDSATVASWQETATPKPVHIKHLADDPSFNRVSDTIIDRVVSTRVAIVLTGTAAALLAGCGVAFATMNRPALATWWSTHSTAP